MNIFARLKRALQKGGFIMGTDKGRLVIFTSYTPGAGKTYTMVKRAIEDYDNPKVALINDEHRDIEKLLDDYGIDDIDIDEYSIKELLAEKPDVVVLDEMGMYGFNTDYACYVYQDITTLIDAGIDVYTSANLKRFDGANKYFAEITGIRVKRRIPDDYLEQAEKIVFVDRDPKLMEKDFKTGKLFTQKHMKSKIMKKNFKLKTLNAYRDVSKKFLETYKDKLEIVER